MGIRVLTLTCGIPKNTTSMLTETGAEIKTQAGAETENSQSLLRNMVPILKKCIPNHGLTLEPKLPQACQSLSKWNPKAVKEIPMTAKAGPKSPQGLQKGARRIHKGVKEFADIHSQRITQTHPGHGPCSKTLDSTEFC